MNDIVERDHAALSAMLDAALKRAGARPSAMVDFGLPRAPDDADVLAKAGARYWSADRRMLERTWGPAGKGATCAPHPAGESVSEPPPAMVCSARLA